MGIPAYFRWISEKYPRIMVDCVEFVDIATGAERPIDASKPNPNGEFDNLYLDMNGIIHPCTHPEDSAPPTCEEEMFANVFAYVDRIFSIVRPRKLIYMAIDGVAPRAKINQQRSRRFRSAREAEEKRRLEYELRDEWDKQGLAVVEDEEEEEKGMPFDSNVITPGTPFMTRLSVALRGYLDDRIANTPGWKDVVVIFSDSSVPGEGEHKIAEYIRRERAETDYDPNIKHVMYGLDADLIMLALATHEVNFTILREEVFPKRRGQKHNNDAARSQAMQNDREPKQINTIMAEKAAELGLKTRAELGGKKPFHFLHVNILREYLDYEFKTDIENEIVAAGKSDEIGFNLERVLDDFVFLCFFVGNDFLPHLPTLDIREGAIDFLMELYKSQLPQIGYLTSSQGEVDFNRVRQLLFLVGEKEDQIFKERAEKEQRQTERMAREKEEKEAAKAATTNGDSKKDEETAPKSPKARGKRAHQSKHQGYQDAVFTMATIELGQREAPSLDARMNRKRQKTEHTSTDFAMVTGDGDGDESDKNDAKKNKTEMPVVKKSKTEYKEALQQRIRQRNELEVVDNIKLGEVGWKDRYYLKKFGWGPEHREQKIMLLRKYIEGLQWVMKYYYVGCVSWGWYYPYHYAPFASDLVDCDVNAEDMKFEIGKPFQPFSQLQAVMPASSGKLVLPKCYSDLMTDPNSPIIDYYPENFELDLNGKRFAWQGVALLPFIDEGRLNAALSPLQNLLTEEEKERNSFGECCVVLHRDSALGQARSKKESEDGSELKRVPVEAAFGQLFGKTSYPLTKYGGNKSVVFTLTFELLKFKPHSSQLLPAAIPPRAVLNDATRSDSRRSGWKQARFGSLGRAAKDIIMDRNRRIGRDGSRGRGRPRSMGSSRTGYLPNAPVINRPAYGNQAASNMFGGLGSQQQQPQQQQQQPNWMRGHRSSYPPRSSRGQSSRGQQAQGYYPSHQRHQSRNRRQADSQGTQRPQMDVYRAPSNYGGYYTAGAGQESAMWNGSQQMQTDWQSRGAATPGWGQSNNGSYQGYNMGGYNYNGQQAAMPGGGNGYYGGYQGGYQSQGAAGGADGGSGGGLAGPTAGTLRFPSEDGRTGQQDQQQMQRYDQRGWNNSGGYQ